MKNQPDVWFRSDPISADLDVFPLVDVSLAFLVSPFTSQPIWKDLDFVKSKSVPSSKNKEVVVEFYPRHRDAKMNESSPCFQELLV